MGSLLEHSKFPFTLTFGLFLIASVALGADRTSHGRGTFVGYYAADLVDVDSYRYFMEDELYAHDGDDRGYGPEHDLCRTNIEQLFLDYGLHVSMHPFSYNGQLYHNVVGEIPGTVFPDQIYVIAGHFDSVGNPGADDNASAVATLLEIARIAGRWNSQATIRLISFDREEQGLIGSQAYVNTFAHEDFRGVISLDMVAYSGPDPDKARIHGRTQSDPLKESVAQALVDYAGLTPSVHGALDRTDHAPFEWAGFQGCWLAEYNYIEYNPHYHQQTDSLDTPNYIDFDYGAKITRAVIGWLVDNAGLRPALMVDVHEIPESGGAIDFALDAGASWGERNYLLCGTLSGTSPGTPLPGGLASIPLNRDWFSDYILANLGRPLFTDFWGALDSAGEAQAGLDAPPLPGWAGTTFNFAFCLSDPWDFASNAVAVEVVP